MCLLLTLETQHEEVDETEHDAVSTTNADLEARVVAKVHAAVRHGHEEQHKSDARSCLRAGVPRLSDAQQRLEDEPQTQADGVGSVARWHAVTGDAAATGAVALTALAQTLDQDHSVDNGDDGDEEEGEEPRPAAAVKDELERERDRHEVRHHAVEGEDDVPEAHVVHGHADAEEGARDHVHAARPARAALRVVAAERAALLWRRAGRVLGIGSCEKRE
ncbi:unnamed protein product [Phytophthora fragariaefolia]|uniref:Unnamed protein product n=1 Tax=Phytophthora fragariaefolia TaxID=1490495 RepID=A0A9W6XX73_9STRA|nr:unnamed protein product [Phytophthora fragariaefolia]